jgi:hypothetical protein
MVPRWQPPACSTQRLFRRVKGCNRCPQLVAAAGSISLFSSRPNGITAVSSPSWPVEGNSEAGEVGVAGEGRLDGMSLSGVGQPGASCPAARGWTAWHWNLLLPCPFERAAVVE